jgi:xanthine dehydrogenase accessory factor
VLATIVKVQGHAYRKLGAAMLLYADGERAGGISPGCLEADLEERVPEVLTQGRAQYVEYDMSDPDDFAWGEAVGCGGTIHVLMEPVAGKLETILGEIKLELDCGQACLLSRSWDASGQVSYKVKPSVHHGVSAAAGAASLQLYCSPRPRLIIFGAGTDAEPLAALAGQAGFQVVVADWRESLCCSGRFPAGCDTVAGSPPQLIEQLQINGTDYVVIMSHQLERDRQCLELLLKQPPRYAGLLGSKSRAATILDGRIPPAWLRFPVGLPIGAEGPLEIAISIVAELIAVRRSRVHAGYRRESYGNSGDRHLFGGRTKQAYGGSEAFYPARPKH